MSRDRSGLAFAMRRLECIRNTATAIEAVLSESEFQNERLPDGDCLYDIWRKLSVLSGNIRTDLKIMASCPMLADKIYELAQAAEKEIALIKTQKEEVN